MRKMTPTHTETPLRRSEAGVFRAPVQQTPILNDDEEERRQRRRTAAALDETASTTTIEDNETLKDCIKICSENKLSKENAWSVSVIDTLSKLLEKHHKSFNNFKVAGSSLEASSKVYGLRVDSIHTDVVRLSAGLNKRKYAERNDVDENDGEHETKNDNQNQQDQNPNNSVDGKKQPKRRKRTKKQVSTITKNKDTINSILDTYPFTDPIFAKLNSVQGSINSSGRLLQNILPSVDSEIMLRMDYKFWDATPSDGVETAILSDECDYQKEYENLKLVDANVMDSMNLDNLNLRTLHTGYIICDTPAENENNENEVEKRLPNIDDDIRNNESQLAMAFDINAEIEPIQPETPVFMDVDMGELDDLTIEEQIAITNCRALRRQPVLIEDMRPLDSTSANLEYSYRPMEKINQFWAGPSHWKFKRTTRHSSLNLQQQQSSNHLTATSSKLQQRQNTNYINQQKQRRGRQSKRLVCDKEIVFGEAHDNLFTELDQNTQRKLRKANIQKKWDAKKIKLPTDLQFVTSVFDSYQFAPSLKFSRKRNEFDDDNSISPDLQIESGYNYDNPIDTNYCPNVRTDDDLTDAERDTPGSQDDGRIPPSQAMFEIPTDFDGAPDKVTRIVVPFAKRAKVIDMKQLKKCCLYSIKSQFALTKNKENLDANKTNENLDNLPNNDENSKKNGIATFTKIYSDLPKILTSNMSSALSPSIAFYSILHLANETNLKLIPQSDLRDFQILQIENN